MARIPEDIITQVVDASDIVDVIGSYMPLKRAGASFQALCPFHREKTPSFHVNQARQSFRCFGCGAGGGVIRFVMDYESLEFLPAVRKLAERAGITIPESGGDDSVVRDRKRALKDLHAAAADWFHLRLTRTTEAAAAREYLKGRGIGKQIADSWEIGFAPDAWDVLLQWATERKYSREDLLDSGLIKSRGEENENGVMIDSEIASCSPSGMNRARSLLSVVEPWRATPISRNI